MAPRKRSTKEPEDKLTLLTALEFIKVAQTDTFGGSVPMTEHCRLADGFAVAFDGVLAAGHPIEEELNVCPHTHRLIDALKRCKKAVSITQLDGDKLVIKAGAFRAVIPCLNVAAVPYTTPDHKAGTITDVIKEGFALLNPIVKGAGHTVVEASLLLNNNSMIATDRQVMLEFWHGINLPNGLAIPKAALVAVKAISAPLVGIGVSDRTVTFHYGNGAWLRTQLFAEAWPDVNAVLNKGDAHVAVKVPDGLFDAVDAVASFNPEGVVYTNDAGIASHAQEGVGATYEVKGVPPGLCFNAKHLMYAKEFITRIDLVGRDGITFFYGDNVRGALTQRRG